MHACPRVSRQDRIDFTLIVVLINRVSCRSANDPFEHRAECALAFVGEEVLSSWDEFEVQPLHLSGPDVFQMGCVPGWGSPNQYTHSLTNIPVPLTTVEFVQVLEFSRRRKIRMQLDQPNNPLHGMTLEMILQSLVDGLGWPEMGRRVRIKCFTENPSISSSLKFLRKTPWARKKVEQLYLASLHDGRKTDSSVSHQRRDTN